ncbi:MAG: hypothetical protein R3E96_14880 [Planctomycetota bacterium]
MVLLAWLAGDSAVIGQQPPVQVAVATKQIAPSLAELIARMKHRDAELPGMQIDFERVLPSLEKPLAGDMARGQVGYFKDGAWSRLLSRQDGTGQVRVSMAWMAGPEVFEAQEEIGDLPSDDWKVAISAVGRSGALSGALANDFGMGFGLRYMHRPMGQYLLENQDRCIVLGRGFCGGVDCLVVLLESCSAVVWFDDGTTLLPLRWDSMGLWRRGTPNSTDWSQYPVHEKLVAMKQAFRCITRTRLLDPVEVSPGMFVASRIVLEYVDPGPGQRNHELRIADHGVRAVPGAAPDAPWRVQYPLQVTDMETMEQYYLASAGDEQHYSEGDYAYWHLLLSAQDEEEGSILPELERCEFDARWSGLAALQMAGDMLGANVQQGKSALRAIANCRSAGIGTSGGVPTVACTGDLLVQAEQLRGVLLIHWAEGLRGGAIRKVFGLLQVRGTDVCLYFPPDRVLRLARDRFLREWDGSGLLLSNHLSPR